MDPKMVRVIKKSDVVSEGGGLSIGALPEDPFESPIPEQFRHMRGDSVALVRWKEHKVNLRHEGAPKLEEEKDQERLIKEQERLENWETKLLEREKSIEEERLSVLDKANEDGYKAGYQEGLSVAQSEREVLRETLESLNSEFLLLKSALAQKTFELALCAAAQVVHDSCVLHTEETLDLIRQVLKETNIGSEKLTLISNTMTQRSIKEQIKNSVDQSLRAAIESFEFEIDNTMETSGFIIKGGQSLIDCSIESRWADCLVKLAGGESYSKKMLDCGTNIKKENARFEIWFDSLQKVGSIV